MQYITNLQASIFHLSRSDEFKISALKVKSSRVISQNDCKGNKVERIGEVQGGLEKYFKLYGFRLLRAQIILCLRNAGLELSRVREQKYKGKFQGRWRNFELSRVQAIGGSSYWGFGVK